ncbi:MAG: SpoIIE family protein phosphatase [Nitrospirae bacterium]|nr:SpoIIE family protein phosphatase [Nitrospirota bacterium]
MADEHTVTVSEAFLRGMEKKVEDLKTLTEMSAIISSTLDLDELMSLVMERAKEIMAADACSILFYNRETDKLEFEVAMCREDNTCEVLKKRISLDMGQGIAGWVAENRKPLFIEDVSKDDRFFQDADKLTGFITKSLIAVPLIGRRGLIGVAELLNPGNRGYDPEIFQLLCRQFAIAIENSLFHKESVERERLKQELDIAAVLQKSFLPESPVLKEGALTASAMNISAAKVGGDIYDFIGPANGKLGVLIGDVSGKGVSAALYMAKIISDFRYVAHHMETPDIVLERMNTVLSKSPRGMFLTAIYMTADTSTGEITLAAAGHPPFFLISGESVEVVSMPSGPPLGIIPSEYPSHTLKLKNGDRLIFVTDGVFDAKNKKGERIGFENITEFIKFHPGADNLMDRIIEYVGDFSRGTERADDLTIVEVRWGG